MLDEGALGPAQAGEFRSVGDRLNGRIELAILADLDRVVGQPFFRRTVDLAQRLAVGHRMQVADRRPGP
jgi:hypothetical protein